MSEIIPMDSDLAYVLIKRANRRDEVTLYDNDCFYSDRDVIMHPALGYGVVVRGTYNGKVDLFFPRINDVRTLLAGNQKKSSNRRAKLKELEQLCQQSSNNS